MNIDYLLDDHFLIANIFRETRKFVGARHRRVSGGWQGLVFLYHLHLHLGG